MKKVITYGSFDLFHQGHYNLLKRAKKLGDYLIVGVTTEHYDTVRGKLNVVDPLLKRVENVKKTGFADEIIIEDHEGQKLEDVQKYNIDILTVGSDWKGTFDYFSDYCEVVYLERTKEVSSTMLRDEKFGIVKLGMVGNGSIAKRFVSEIKYVSGIHLKGVFNPNNKSAAAFANEYGLDIATDQYELLLNEIHAVYIASPHETHYDYAKQAIKANRHVFCEKPMVLEKKQAEELFFLAKEHNVILMEAVKTGYTPCFLEMLSVARSGRIGQIRDVEAAFTKLLNPYNENGRLRREFTLNSGGSFTELATYPLFAIIKLLGLDYEKLSFEFIKNEIGLDIYAKAHFQYENAFATAKTGLGVKSEGQLIISGTRGYILVKSPWWLMNSFELCYENTEENEVFVNRQRGYGLRYEISEFVKNINNSNQHHYKISHRDSIAMADIIEQFILYRNKSTKEG